MPKAKIDSKKAETTKAPAKKRGRPAKVKPVEVETPIVETVAATPQPDEVAMIGMSSNVLLRAALSTPIVETVAATPQPDEVVVGRFYEITDPNGYKMYGELIESDGFGQVVQKWTEGKPDVSVSVLFEEHAVREIDRTLCYELSHSHINPQG